MNNVDKLRKVVKRLVTEQINTDRRLVIELDDIDSSLKKLNKKYKALVNNSFSRVVLDDGQDGKLFDIQLYPVGLSKEDGVYKYDMRAYFHNADRCYRNGLHLDDVKEFIDNELSTFIEENSSYQRKALMKGKRPYIEDDEYDYAEEGTMKTPETDQMEEVKDVKKQSDFTPEDLADRKLEELKVGLGLDELAEKIENSIWGAIKREGESTHSKTAKADHDIEDSDTARNKHVLTKTKLRKAKTKKIKEKSKDQEHISNINVTPTKVNTPKVKDFKDDKRKAVNESRELKEIIDNTKVITPQQAQTSFNNLLVKLNKYAASMLGHKKLFYTMDSVDYQTDQDGENVVTAIIYPEVRFSVDVSVSPTEGNIQKIQSTYDKYVGNYAETKVEHAYDNADGTEWIGVNSFFGEQEVEVPNLANYVGKIVMWAKTVVGLTKKVKDAEKKTVNEGLFDKIKSKVKGNVAGLKGAAKHQIDKWEAAGGALRSKAAGDREALKTYRDIQKKLADKERHRTAGQTGKRSIFKTEKEKAAAGSLFSSYSRKLNNRVSSFITDLSKVLDVSESEIIPYFKKIGLEDQSNALERLFKDISSFNKLSKMMNLNEGLFDRGAAKIKGALSGIGQMGKNLQARDRDIKDAKVVANLKKASVLFDGFKKDISKIVSQMGPDFSGFENKNFKSIPVRLQRTIEDLSV